MNLNIRHDFERMDSQKAFKVLIPSCKVAIGELKVIVLQLERLTHRFVQLIVLGIDLGAFWMIRVNGQVFSKQKEGALQA